MIIRIKERQKHGMRELCSTLPDDDLLLCQSQTIKTLLKIGNNPLQIAHAGRSAICAAPVKGFGI